MSDKIQNEVKNSEKNEILGEIRRIRGELDRLFETAKRFWWTPREYAAKFQVYETLHAYPDPPQRPETREDGLIVPDVSAVFVFGTEYIMPGSQYPGLPETGYKSFGLQYAFNAKQLEINDEDAPHFVIENFSIGAAYLFGIAIAQGAVVPATRFAASAEKKIAINHYGHDRADARIIVRNTSDQPRAFRAKLIGLESSPDVEEQENA